jgi:rubrerythrin
VQGTADPYQEILRVAIEREVEARQLYLDMAARVEDEQAKELLQELAAQEEGHRNRLQAVLSAGADPELLSRQSRRVTDLRITDFLREMPLDENADVQQVLIVAGKREAGSYDLYSAMASISEDEETEALFRYLAGQELEHKHRVERLYEDLYYTEV